MQVKHDNNLMDVALRAFEKKIVAGDMKSVLWTIMHPDNGPFGSYMAALYLSKLAYYATGRNGHFTEAVIEETMIADALKGLFSSFNEEYWEMWLEAAHTLTNSSQGWEARKGGWVDRRDTILRSIIKPVYKRVFEICEQHDTRNVQNYIIKGLAESLVENVMKYAEWNESPADYGITPDLLDKIFFHSNSGCIRRRLQNGIFATPKEAAVWQSEWEIEKLTSILPLAEELKASHPASCGDTLEHIQQRIRDEKKKLEELRK